MKTIPAFLLPPVCKQSPYSLEPSKKRMVITCEIKASPQTLQPALILKVDAAYHERQGPGQETFISHFANWESDYDYDSESESETAPAPEPSGGVPVVQSTASILPSAWAPVAQS